MPVGDQEYISVGERPSSLLYSSLQWSWPSLVEIFSLTLMWYSRQTAEYIVDIQVYIHSYNTVLKDDHATCWFRICVSWVNLLDKGNDLSSLSNKQVGGRNVI